MPTNNIVWESEVGTAITDLMLTIYESLDLAVFRRDGNDDKPTHLLYKEFIQKNGYVCPFCGLSKYKNKLGLRREDFDHYLHKSEYPLAAANMNNLVPTCGTCNQDYKKAKNILGDGKAFYPYSAVPEVKLEVMCQQYPAVQNFSDKGKWKVNIELSAPDANVIPKMKAWDRVYSIKTRLESEITEFFEDWMKEIADDQTIPLAPEQFIGLIQSAKTKAIASAKRKMQPGQIIKAAFFDFMLTGAEKGFVESFRHSQNRACS